MITRYRLGIAHEHRSPKPILLADQGGALVLYEDIERAGKVDDAMVERLKAFAKSLDEAAAWLANHEDGDCEPYWSDQETVLEGAKVCREAIAALEAASLPVGAEAATKLAMPTDPEWYTRKAALEEGHEVGAGSGALATPKP